MNTRFLNAEETAEFTRRDQMAALDKRAAYKARMKARGLIGAPYDGESPGVYAKKVYDLENPEREKPDWIYEPKTPAQLHGFKR